MELAPEPTGLSAPVSLVRSPSHERPAPYARDEGRVLPAWTRDPVPARLCLHPARGASWSPGSAKVGAQRERSDTRTHRR